jgi:NADH-quinone oxidoreductase subunit J
VTPDVIAFWAFAALTVLGALLTILSRNPVHSAIWLIASLLGTAGLFLLQKAEFLFAVQVVLYVGGIMVLFLFVIMLVNLDQEAKRRQFNGQWALGIAAVALVAFEASYFVWKGLPKLPAPAAETADAPAGNTERLADLLFTEYLVPFEVASLLLLAAVVGSVLMARGRRA